MHVVITSSDGAVRVLTDEMVDQAVAQTMSPAFDLVSMIMAIIFWYVILELVFIVLTITLTKDHSPRCLTGLVYHGISKTSHLIVNKYRAARQWIDASVIQRISQWNARGKTMKFKKNPEFDEVEAWQAKKDFTIEHNGCKVDVKAGHWVGQDGFGNLKIFTDDVFRKAYVPTDDSEFPASLVALPAGKSE